jgi:hypothetical protein
VRWPVLQTNARRQPPTGRWHEWKQQIADFCQARCIYCAIPEGRFGGLRNFHVEHFRPKVRFPHLENEIRNLYLACAICNVLKCDDWPAEPIDDHSVAAYPDPAVSDYNSIFDLDGRTHEVQAASAAGQYVIERVMLNRAQLVLQRRLYAVLEALKEFESWIPEAFDHMSDGEKRAAMQVLIKIVELTTAALEARPYRDSETKRSTRTKAARQRSRQ